jgi:hypothetical protein
MRVRRGWPLTRRAGNAPNTERRPFSWFDSLPSRWLRVDDAAADSSYVPHIKAEAQLRLSLKIEGLL